MKRITVVLLLGALTASIMVGCCSSDKRTPTDRDIDKIRDVRDKEVEEMDARKGSATK
jgi:hypothetical protein